MDRSVEMTLSYQTAPPESFNFSRTDEWPRWIRRFERFRQATGLVNTLIYTMGDAADNIFMLEDEDRKKYEVVKENSRNIS